MIEISEVLEDYDTLYFYASDNGRGCWQNVEVPELRNYFPKGEYDFDKEVEGAIYKWANDNNLDISKLPHIEDATPAMRLLYKRVSSSENNMFYLDLEEGEDFKETYRMTQEEFEKQVDSDVKKYGLEDVVLKDYDESLYACFANLQSSFTEKVHQNSRVEDKNLNDTDALEKLKYEKIEEKDFESAYKYAQEAEVFNEDLAKTLALQLGWKKNWEIKEIQGDKYIYNPDKYDFGGTDMDQLEFEAYKIGQKLDSDGDILKALIVCPAKDYFDDYFDKRLTDRNAIIFDDNGSLCLYNDKPNHPDGGKRGRVGIIEPLDMRFMKDVMEIHGANLSILSKASQTISDIKDETPEFARNLLNNTLKTEEYKELSENKLSNDKIIPR